MMQCPNCGQETDEGKFCMHCGTPLTEEHAAALAESNPGTTSQMQEEQPQNRQYTQGQQTNEVIENIKSVGIDFGRFFSKLFKRPSMAKHATDRDMVSGIISSVLFSVIFSIGYFLLLKSFTKAMSGFGSIFGVMDPNVSFVDGLLWPLVNVI